MHRRAWWHNKFNCFGARLTESREIIINILNDTDEHLSAEDIYLKAHKKNPSIGLTTVYRTIDLLTQMSIVQKFDFGDGRARYELIKSSSGKNHHHHLVCVRCKRIINYTELIKDELDLINKTEKELSKKYNFKIMNHIIHFYGLCENCQ
ncbi:MAG: transcriptional repressor [Spirochaetes bacterium]|nr:transcriptional repressor [Spirochaetota bacterium]